MKPEWVWDNAFSTYAIILEKNTFLPRWYTHLRGWLLFKFFVKGTFQCFRGPVLWVIKNVVYAEEEVIKNMKSLYGTNILDFSLKYKFLLVILVVSCIDVIILWWRQPFK